MQYNDDDDNDDDLVFRKFRRPLIIINMVSHPVDIWKYNYHCVRPTTVKSIQLLNVFC